MYVHGILYEILFENRQLKHDKNAKFYIHISWKIFEYESMNEFRSGNNIVVLPIDMYFRCSQHEILKVITDNQASHIISKSGNDEPDVFRKRVGLVS